MRKFFHYLGKFVLISVGALCLGAGWLLHEEHVLNLESKDFVDAAVPAIAGNWSQEQLLDRATPELLGNIQPGELKAMFGTFARIGPLVEYQGARGEATLRIVNGIPRTVAAAYVAKGKFQNGDAVFDILLLKRNGRWLIQTFRVVTKPSGPSAERA